MTLAFGLFLSMANFAFGQIVCNKNENSSVIYPIRQPNGSYEKIEHLADDKYDKEGNTDWSGEYFIKNGINTIYVYSYCFDITLKNIEDSFLFRREQFDIQENKILEVIYARGWGETNTEKYYNTNGQIIKERERYDNGRYYYLSSNFEQTDYEYDSLHREIKKTEKEISRNSSKRDTSEIVYAKINEYVYNSNNQKIEWRYISKRERTKYFTTKRKPKTNCEYLSGYHTKWKYDSLSNLIEEISFSENNEIDYKKNYFYDNQNRVIKQIDSSWWRSYPDLEKTIMYEYTDAGKIETRIYSENNHKNTISYYNNDNKIVKDCYDDTYTSKENCAEYFYFYENDKLTKKTKKLLMELFL